MSNVVIQFPSKTDEPRMLGPVDSPLYFTAVERPLYWERKAPEHGSHASSRVAVPSHKVLLRHDNGSTERNPPQLAVVGKKYQVIQNKELFHAIEQQLISSLQQDIGIDPLQDAQVYDSMSHGGKTCFREYRFPNMRCDVGKSTSDVAFRIVALNGFGGSAVKLYTGAIDFFCTNGMITGEYDAFYARHSSGLRITNIEQHIKRAVDVFYKQADVWKHWMHTKLTPAAVQSWVQEHFSPAMTDKLVRQYLIETHIHGETKWALYSALTYYATHNEGLFTTRQTDNDHVALTLHKREKEVTRRTSDDVWQQLGEAA